MTTDTSQASQPTGHQYDTLTEATTGLKERGYVAEFDISPEGRLHATNEHTTEYFGPDEVEVDEFHRYEGESDPNDMTIIFALTTKAGQKGVLIDAFGTYSDMVKDQFIKHLNVHHGGSSPAYEHRS